MIVTFSNKIQVTDSRGSSLQKNKKCLSIADVDNAVGRQGDIRQFPKPNVGSRILVGIWMSGEIMKLPCTAWMDELGKGC